MVPVSHIVPWRGVQCPGLGALFRNGALGPALFMTVEDAPRARDLASLRNVSGRKANLTPAGGSVP